MSFVEQRDPEQAFPYSAFGLGNPPDVWVTSKAPDGRESYWNLKEGNIVWDLPDGAKVVDVVDKETSQTWQFRSFCTIRPGKNRDGYWKGEDVVGQLKEVLHIAEFLYPNKKLCFVFDNSSNHGLYKPGALCVGQGCNKMPRGLNAPGSSRKKGKNTVKVPRMRDGWWRGPDGARIEQPMHFEDETGASTRGTQRSEFAGMWKGMYHILRERGRVPDDPKCAPRATGTAKNPCAPRIDGEPVHCCLKHILEDEPDFKEQKTWLEEVIADAGHICMMLPKFHPELNPIERVWGSLKNWLRHDGINTWQELSNKIDGAIAAIDPAEVRRYYRGVQRFEEIYRREFRDGRTLPPRLRDYVMKKFPRHREFPESLWVDVDKALSVSLAAVDKKLAGDVNGASKTAAKKKKKLDNLLADWKSSKPKATAEE
jgi:hypothetical protein